MSIEVRNLTKTFGTFTALKNIRLTVPSGELVALLGPSGSGKTTLLRIIAGLEFADAGTVLFDGQDTTHHSVRERRVGFVFQHYALFRHMSVYENVAFGLRVRPRATRPTRAEIDERVARLLNLVQLERMRDRFPSQLSGGQRQRVALARALAVEPKVLLLDEPFGALDAKVRAELRSWLRRLHDEIQVTSVFVTHDQEEALEVADHVVVMREGGIEQEGTPEDIYHRPANAFVYDFIGHVNVFHARVHEGRAYIDGSGIDRAQAKMFVRPHMMELSYEPQGEHSFKARVKHINPAGPVVRVELISAWSQIVQVDVSQERYHQLTLACDAEVFVTPKKTHIYAADYEI